MNPGLRETRIRENVWVWTFGGESIPTSYGANCTAVVGREAALLVDPFIAPVLARRVEETLRAKTALPLRHVVLTHHHTDHALGAGFFASRGVEVVAHRVCAERMSAEHPGLVASRRLQPDIADLFRDAEPYIPSRIFDEEVTLDLGGTEARLLHPGHNHTPGDAVVHLTRESVVICGDLVSSSYHVNYEDADVANLERGLETLRALEAGTYIPGHGPAGGPELLDAELRYHRAIVEAAASGEGPERLERIRSRFPDYRLESVLPAAFTRRATASPQSPADRRRSR